MKMFILALFVVKGMGGNGAVGEVMVDAWRGYSEVVGNKYGNTDAYINFENVVL